MSELFTNVPSEPPRDSEVPAYFWRKAALWFEKNKIPPSLDSVMDLAKLLEETCIDGSTSDRTPR